MLSSTWYPEPSVSLYSCKRAPDPEFAIGPKPVADAELTAKSGIRNDLRQNMQSIPRIFRPANCSFSTRVRVKPIVSLSRQVYLDSALVAAIHRWPAFYLHLRPGPRKAGRRYDNGNRPCRFILAQPGQLDIVADRARSMTFENRCIEVGSVQSYAARKPGKSALDMP